MPAALPSRHRRGDVRSDGKVFVLRSPKYAGGEYWATREIFESIQAAAKVKYTEAKERAKSIPKVLKTGQVRSDGMVFWAYANGYPDREYWVTPSQFKAKRHASRVRVAALQADPEFRGAANIRRRLRYQNDPEFRAARLAQEKSPESRLRQKKYRSKPEFRRKVATRVREERRRDPLINLKTRLRCRVSESFRRRGWTKTSRTRDLLGCDYENLISHFESQFLPGMSWANRHLWHIDHIIPLASASNEGHMMSLCHFTNLQPLWAADNMSKGSRIFHHHG